MRLDPISAFQRLVETISDLSMANGLARFIGQQILLGDIGHIFCLGIFGIEMIEGLVLARPHIGGNGHQPFFR